MSFDRGTKERLCQVVLQVLQQDASNPEFNEQQATGAIQTVENAPRLIFSALNVLDLSLGAPRPWAALVKAALIKAALAKEPLAKEPLAVALLARELVARATDNAEIDAVNYLRPE
jgi:hypothetical protein